MKCMPRTIPRAEVDQGITQRDQFNTDEFTICETLVREPHQNSLDGKSMHANGPVRTRIRLVEPNKTHSPYWKSLLEPLRPHLEASKIDLSTIDLSMPRILLIEDFGTTGLIGDVENKDDQNFSDFWRRFGLSHKKGGAGGRWGLGKLVFTSASVIGTLFGLTIRDDDPKAERILMGQAILNNHKVGSTSYAPHVFFAVAAEDGFQLPERETAAVEAFVMAAGITRKQEPGLSIAVICLQPDLEPSKLLPHVINNYYFPILTDRLIVEVNDQVVENASFDQLAKTYGGGNLADGHLINYIRSVEVARNLEPTITLSNEWSTAAGVTGSLTDAQITKLRDAYLASKLIHIRAPIGLRRKNGTTESTFVDAFMQKTPEQVKSQALFVRGSITIPGEAKSFRGQQTYAALLATDAKIVEFLGDAENPAHTRWVGSAKKLTDNWMAPGEKVAAIKRLLNDINDLLVDTENRIDESALVEFFSIPKPVVAKREKPSPTPRPPRPDIPTSPPRAFNVASKLGGFIVKGNIASDVVVPYQIKIEMGYGVRRGKSFKKHTVQDFDVRSSKSIEAKLANVSWRAIEKNIVHLDVADHNFRFELSGFDTERDLELDVRQLR